MSGSESRGAEQDEAFVPPALRAPRGGRGWALFGARLLLDARVGGIWWIARRHLPSWSGRIIDVGCGDGPWRWLLSSSAQYTGIDVPLASAQFGYGASGACQVIYDGMHLPFADESFSHLLCTEVLEHVAEPSAFVSECRRITAAGGTCFFSVPFAARYHYVPYDYWRFTPSSLERLFRGAGWDQFRIMPIGTDVAVAAYKVKALYLRLLPLRKRRSLMSLVSLLTVVLAPVFMYLTAIEVISTRFNIGSPLDPLGYVVLAVRGKSAETGANGR